MKITGFESDRIILKEIGERARLCRIQQGLTQNDLSENAGTSLSTIVRLEKGDSIKLEVFIAVLKSLGIASNLDVLVPEYVEKPTDRLDKKSKPQRVGKKIQKKQEWTWMEDK